MDLFKERIGGGEEDEAGGGAEDGSIIADAA
jgi:hypothetical protein